MGGGQDLGGLCLPGPNVEPPLIVRGLGWTFYLSLCNNVSSSVYFI